MQKEPDSLLLFRLLKIRRKHVSLQRHCCRQEMFVGKSPVGAILLVHIGTTAVNYSTYRTLGGPSVNCMEAVNKMFTFTSVLMFTGRATF